VLSIAGHEAEHHTIKAATSENRFENHQQDIVESEGFIRSYNRSHIALQLFQRFSIQQIKILLKQYERVLPLREENVHEILRGAVFETQDTFSAAGVSIDNLRLQERLQELWQEQPQVQTWPKARRRAARFRLVASSDRRKVHMVTSFSHALSAAVYRMDPTRVTFHPGWR
jgi:hypothetical protein